MLQLARAQLRATLPRTLAAARSIHIKAPGYGSPEAEGPLYSHTAAVVHGIHNPDPNANETKPRKERDPKSKNHKVKGGSNFQELKKMHNVSEAIFG